MANMDVTRYCVFVQYSKGFDWPHRVSVGVIGFTLVAMPTH